MLSKVDRPHSCKILFFRAVLTRIRSIDAAPSQASDRYGVGVWSVGVKQPSDLPDLVLICTSVCCVRNDKANECPWITETTFTTPGGIASLGAFFFFLLNVFGGDS